jgi:hypothetical protein
MATDPRGRQRVDPLRAPPFHKLIFTQNNRGTESRDGPHIAVFSQSGWVTAERVDGKGCTSRKDRNCLRLHPSLQNRSSTNCCR